jgi:hypothetical protein
VSYEKVTFYSLELLQMSNPTTPPTDKLDWQNIGFQYRDINGYAKYTWTPENGWDEGSLETNPYLNVHMCSTGLNYGQEVRGDGRNRGNYDQCSC